MTSARLMGGILLAIAAGCARTGPGGPSAGVLASDDRTPFFVEIPEAAHRFEMVPIPGSPDGTIKPFFMAATETTWDAFDVYVFKLDQPGNEKADAVTRPSKPYIPPDRGFGHAGYAVISVSFRNATEYCAWLSARTGRKFRLPTEAEWQHACLAGATTPYYCGEDAASLAEFAWFEANSDYSPQPVAKKKPSPWGLFDVHGNVQEWVTTSDGKSTTCGGSFRDPPEKLAAAARSAYQPGWQASDPQVPKSPWWLSDAPFVGFRVICE